MYNRYVPQPDGSYRRNRVSEPQRRPTSPPPCPPEPPAGVPGPPACPLDPPPACKNCQHGRCGNRRPEPPKQERSVGGFLHNLIPKDFDTGDLLIVLLLLLMSGDCAEDQNTALLTLALYFFL